MSAKFGPAGNSESFAAMKYKSSLDVPEYIEKWVLMLTSINVAEV